LSLLIAEHQLAWFTSGKAPPPPVICCCMLVRHCSFAALRARLSNACCQQLGCGMCGGS
jgi:hypothetical protein